MDNYLLCGHILVCKMIPKEEVHPELWVGANRKWRKVPVNQVVRMVHNRVRLGQMRLRIWLNLASRNAILMSESG